ncbi:unnamed protein product [Microthlaspi erraticum]|uniref:Uncharacterized protein n=1 Tax=Microthlaspi erraticum TaxID=1685480 RepID=A0A6D2IRA5_9BRAS|nr:unnamed protein product [Microthlaspi erraticum]
MSYRNTDVANPQDQVYPQQQQARSSQAPQHGYGPKNNYQGPQGTFPGQQMHIPPGFPHQPPQPAPTPEHELKAMLKQLLQGQADGVDNYLVKLFRTPRNSARSSYSRRLDEEEDQERVKEEFCMLLNDDDIVAAKAPKVQIDQPEVQATTVAFHTSPVELAQQARSAARSSRTLARSSQTSSVLKPILLDPYQPVHPTSGRLLVKAIRK